jgi:HAD superfamily hydrolase (TIGR01549 family)
MYKGIVFDLDGTLVDSPLCFDSIRSELEIPEGHFILEYLDQLPPEAQIEKRRRLEEIEAEAARQAKPISGVLELLRELRGRGVPVGIFTRNCRVATELVIAMHGFEIDMVVTRDEAPAKPDPTGLRLFLTEWKLAGHEILFVGDFHFDIDCGKRAGVKTALFTNGGEAEGDLRPDHVIPHFSVFWDCLEPHRSSTLGGAKLFIVD